MKQMATGGKNKKSSVNSVSKEMKILGWEWVERGG